MKRIFRFLFFFILFLPLFSTAQQDFRLLVRGQEIFLQNYAVENKILFIHTEDSALNQMASLLGGAITWDSQKEILTLSKENHQATISSSKFEIDGNPTSLSVPALREQKNPSGFYVSVNAVAKAFQASLVVDASKEIWYLDPFLTQLFLNTKENRLDLGGLVTASVQPEVTHVPNPDRIVLDLPFVVLSPKLQTPVLPSNPFVEEIHLSQFQAKPNIVRVVLTIKENQKVDWEIQTSQNGRQFSVSLEPAVNGFALIRKPEESKEEKAATPPSRLMNIFAETGRSPTTETFTATFHLSRAVHYEWHQLKPPDNRIFLDLSNCLQEIAKLPEYDTSLIKGIKIAQYQKTPIPIVRIVFDLNEAFSADINPTPQGFQVVIHSLISTAVLPASGAGESGGDFAFPQEKPTAKFPAHPNGITVVLDPGHGGSDPGARGSFLVEKNVTLDIALLLRDYLVANGFSVILTHSEDRDALRIRGSAKMELQARADTANQVKASLFISLHLNSSEVPWPHGIESHWYKAMDLPLAVMMQKHLSRESGFQDRGTPRNRYYVLSHTFMPAVLLELGFLSNRGDESKLAKSEYRERLARAIADGVLEYANVRKN